MKKLFTILIVLAFIACSKQIYTPTEANVNKREPATLAELQQGHDLFVKNCGRCHKLPRPESHSAQQWTKVLDKMGPKAKLDKDQVSLVYKFVVNY